MLGGRTFLRRLIDLTLPLRANHHRTWVNREARADIEWWQSGLASFHGFSPFPCDMKPPEGSLVTDACRVGGAGLFGDDWFYTHFETDFPDAASEHINSLELLTVLVAARRWGHRWSGHHVRVFSDNTSTVHSINKGTSRSPVFMRCIRELFWLSVVHNFRLTAAHVKGENNVLADLISRLHMPSYARKFVNMFGGRVNCYYKMSFSSFLALQVALNSETC